MLNKELMLYSKEDLPYTHTLRVGRDENSDYLYLGKIGGGELSPNTVLINDSHKKIASLHSAYEKYNNLEHWKLFFNINWYSPIVPLYLGRTDTREIVYYTGSDFETGYIEYTNSQRLNIKFTEEDVGKDVHLWIATDPPPWKGLLP